MSGERGAVGVAWCFIVTVDKARHLGEIAPICLEIVVPAAAVPVLLIRHIPGVSEQRHAVRLLLLPFFRSAGEEYSLLRSAFGEEVHRSLRRVSQRPGEGQVDCLSGFVRDLCFKQSGGNARVLRVLRDERVEGGQLHRNGAVRVVERYFGYRELPPEDAVAEVREALHRGVRETEAVVLSGLTGEIFEDVTAEDAGVEKLSVPFGFDGEVRVSVI